MFDRHTLDSVSELTGLWEKKMRELAHNQPRAENSPTTTSGIPVQPFYSPADIAGMDYAEKLSLPGCYPFTRGIKPDMYRSGLWVMGQYGGFGSAKDTNRRYKYLLQQGQNGFGMAFDLPTQLGYDSDHPRAEGEVGKVGVAVSSIDDMRTLLEGIPLDKVLIRVIANAPTAVVLAMIVACAEEMGYPLSSLRLALQNDILKEFTSRGNYIFPPGPSMRLFVDVLEFCVQNMPHTIPVYFCGYHAREAGANAIQEVAFTLANAIAYVQAGIDRGLDPNIFGKNLMFYYSCHTDFFEEIAKLRAARRLWAKIMRDRFSVHSDEACKAIYYTTSSGHTLTAQEPYNNIIRVTIQALIGILGGTQVMHLASMDEALSIPTEASVKIAIRTQQVLAYECGLTNTADPLGGSYYVEYLTDEIEKRVLKELEKIDSMGGVIRAIESGYIQRNLAESAYQYHKAIESGERIVLGVNKFRSESEVAPEIFRLRSDVGREQIQRLKEFKSSRDMVSVRDSLSAIEEACTKSDNLVPLMVQAVKAGVTLGEICGVLRARFGEYKEAIS